MPIQTHDFLRAIYRRDDATGEGRLIEEIGRQMLCNNAVGVRPANALTSWMR
jgi:hypothetical protein